MLNEDLFYFFNHSFINPLFDFVMPILTHLGGFISLIFILIVILLYAHLKKNDTLRNIAFIALIALLACDGVAAVLKHFIHEARPFAVLSNVHLLISEGDPYSFPSGHTTSTFAVVTIFFANMKRLIGDRYKLVNALLVVFALLIPFSRIYVGVHYPGDVLAGAVIGLVGGLIVYSYQDRILEIAGKILPFVD